MYATAFSFKISEGEWNLFVLGFEIDVAILNSPKKTEMLMRQNFLLQVFILLFRHE